MHKEDVIQNVISGDISNRYVLLYFETYEYIREIYLGDREKKDPKI